VHEHGGHALALELRKVPVDTNGRRCAIGAAVSTPAVGGLGLSFAHLLHVVPPLRSSTTWKHDLFTCYSRALDLANLAAQTHRVAPIGSCRLTSAVVNEPLSTNEVSSAAFHIATPLLGAGARGASPEEAAEVALSAIGAWRQTTHANHASIRDTTRDSCGPIPPRLVVHFGLIDKTTERCFERAFLSSGDWDILTD